MQGVSTPEEVVLVGHEDARDDDLIETEFRQQGKSEDNPFIVLSRVEPPREKIRVEWVAYVPPNAKR
ncbi:unnamed protein product [Vitrella brassicaformis CCMP3155]|uniref:Uncharacterized protein n=1 Tax=Vitrella brassicaformis (strain CCMP3155) TaxID=1169540 RepID=A0A0G4GCR1_VITBC|nr:unnamed protein product [Vitrella brassicaformis CCMP3155]|eukprot:CEM26934.1 unnamed protein product [Vitrella brassicaformis CCMP3155]